MKSFLIGLQFLTRIQIVWQDSWTAEDFGRSTRLFPLVGLVLGVLYTAFACAMVYLFRWGDLTALLTLLVTVALTGGIHYDGFMDSMDGLLSGRGRERILEIMHDSRVGSYGALSAMCLLLLNWALLGAFVEETLYIALFTMPIIGRMAMVLVIYAFPYARPEGLGKAFSDMADKKTLGIAGAITLALVLPCGPLAWIALAAGLVFAYLFGRRAAKKIGGVTGDIYGAAELMTETVVLLVFVLVPRLGFF